MLNYFYKLGYIDQLPQQYSEGNSSDENIYYFTPKIKEINNTVTSNLSDKEIVKRYLYEIE